MKEATGEGSMTIITIVIIVLLAAAAAVVIGIMSNKAGEAANNTNAGDYQCTETNGKISCAKKSNP